MIQRRSKQCIVEQMNQMNLVDLLVAAVPEVHDAVEVDDPVLGVDGCGGEDLVLSLVVIMSKKGWKLTVLMLDLKIKIWR